MSEFGQNLKNAVRKGIEAIGNTASNLAVNTRQKVEEFNLSNQLKDIYAEIGEKVFNLSKQGTVFPEELAQSLNLEAETEKELNLIREQKDDPSAVSEEAYRTGEINQETDPAAPEAAASYTASDDTDVPVIHVEEDPEEKSQAEPADNSPLSSAINDLFENMPPVDKMVDKVNTSLDELGDSLRKFSGEFDR